MCKQTLESLGYEVTVRTSPIEALELFKIKPAEFDLVITDLTMPNMTGERLARKLVEIRPDLPVILCTGFSAQISRNRKNNTDIKALIKKPLLKQELAETIHRTLNKKRI